MKLDWCKSQIVSEGENSDRRRLARRRPSGNVFAKWALGAVRRAEAQRLQGGSIAGELTKWWIMLTGELPVAGSLAAGSQGKLAGALPFREVPEAQARPIA